MPQDFPTTTIGESNANMLIKAFKPTIQQTLMEKYHSKFRLSKFTIIYDKQIAYGQMHQHNSVILDQCASLLDTS
jgi:hypothetical protein